MKVLIYKRTHIGDPDHAGRFGVRECMRRVRSWRFDAVIGVGGISEPPFRQGIARRVTWVGIGPKCVGKARDGYPLLEFEQFCLLDAEGPWLEDLAPRLAATFYRRAGPRFVMLEADDQIKAILKLAWRVKSAKASTPGTSRKPCPPSDCRTRRKAC